MNAIFRPLVRKMGIPDPASIEKARVECLRNFAILDELLSRQPFITGGPLASLIAASRRLRIAGCICRWSACPRHISKNGIPACDSGHAAKYWNCRSPDALAIRIRRD